jgi:hypothetical protein
VKLEKTAIWWSGYGWMIGSLAVGVVLTVLGFDAATIGDWMLATAVLGCFYWIALLVLLWYTRHGSRE